MRLSDLYDAMTKEQRDDLAARTGIKPQYLYQLATQWAGRKPSLQVLANLAAADDRLSVAELVDEFTEPPEKQAA